MVNDGHSSRFCTSRLELEAYYVLFPCEPHSAVSRTKWCNKGLKELRFSDKRVPSKGNKESDDVLMR